MAKKRDPNDVIISDCGEYKGSFGVTYKEVNKDMVYALAQQCVPDTDIAKIAGISVPTLVKKYQRQLDTGRENTKAKLRNKLVQLALGNDTKVLLFLARTWLKMNDKQVIEINDTRDELKDVTDDELVSIMRNSNGKVKQIK